MLEAWGRRHREIRDQLWQPGRLQGRRGNPLVLMGMVLRHKCQGVFLDFAGSPVVGYSQQGNTMCPEGAFSS